MKPKPKVLFICKKRLDDYGFSFGLFNSANFIAEFLNSRGIEAKTVVAVDGNVVDKEVTDYDPTHVIVEAIWVTPDKFRALLSLRRHKHRQWVVRIHSKVPFLANEGIAFDWLKEYAKISREFSNFIVAPNSKEITRDLKEVFRLKTVYLPNIYWPLEFRIGEVDESKQHIDIGCFGAIRPMKNQLIQAIAAIRFANRIGRKLRFHINGTRHEQRGEQVLKNLRALFEGTSGKHELVEHHWTPHDQFVAIIRHMDMGMQVSLSETFNIVAADFVSNGVPVIGSPEIEWLPKMFRANPNSSDDIVSALTFTNAVKKWKLHLLNNLWLYFNNLRAQRKWVKFMST